MDASSTGLARNRRESQTKPREQRPLFTTEALPTDRKRPPPSKPKKRKQPTPPTPALSFDPKQSRIRSGRQDPTPPTPSSSLSPSDSSFSGSFEEPNAFALDSPSQSLYGSETPAEYDSSCKWIHVAFMTTGYSSTSTPAMPATSTEYDSPLAYASSSSPATTDHAPTHLSENPGYEGLNCQMPPAADALYQSYSYGGAAYGDASDDPYIYGREHGTMGYQLAYQDPSYAVATPNTVPSYTRGHWHPPHH
ncbi:hypothetical protein ID866_4141 [Astraeus odoratus]|nr:hypothetical protein ID866_4141 [Astraeus odoratus]